LDLEFKNNAGNQLSQFAVKFNDNFLGISPAAPLTPGVIANGSSKTYALALSDNKPGTNVNVGMIQIAIKTELGVFYFNQPAFAYTGFTEDGKLDEQTFLGQWRAIPDTAESSQMVSGRTVNSVEDIKKRFAPHNVFFIANRKVGNATALYFSAKFKGQAQLLEIKVEGPNTIVLVKNRDASTSPAVLHAVATLLTK